jgi:hypothetical protein
MLGETMSRGSLFFLLMCIFLIFTDSAQAVECQTSVQSSDGHWAWRLIDGRRCWYKGESGMDKSLLHWPSADEGRDTLEVTPDKPKGEKVQAIPQIQSIPSEVLQMLPILPPQPSFEDRWRLH